MARTINIGSMAPGVNNRLEQTQLETTLPNRSKLQALAAGENIDIDDAGGVRRRRGYTQRLAGTFHSLWGDGKEGFVVRGTDLLRLTPAGPGLTAAVLRSDMGGAPASFDRFPDGSAIYSDGAVLGRVLNGVNGPVIAPPLAIAPTYTVAAGGLRAGRYTLVATAMLGDIESAATPPVQISVPDDSAIVVSGLPGSPVRVYMTAPNGQEPTLEIETSAASITLATHSASGIRCQTMMLATMPPGRIVRSFNGRLLVASGPFLFASEPYYYGVYNAAKGYIPFPADITVVQPVKGGVYVVADQTYWLSADLETDLRPLLPYGALPGSGGSAPDRKTVHWISDRGLIVGDEAGQVKNVQEDALALGGGLAGATLYRERNGSKHIVTLRTGAEPVLSASGGYLKAEITRKALTP